MINLFNSRYDLKASFLNKVARKDLKLVTSLYGLLFFDVKKKKELLIHILQGICGQELRI